MRGLLEHTLSGCRLAAMSSLEQADAEEAMGEWLASAGVENAYTIAPSLVGMGFDRQELDCAREYFDAAVVFGCAELAGGAGLECFAGLRD